MARPVGPGRKSKPVALTVFPHQRPPAALFWYGGKFMRFGERQWCRTTAYQLPRYNDRSPNSIFRTNNGDATRIADRVRDRPAEKKNFRIDLLKLGSAMKFPPSVLRVRLAHRARQFH